MKGRARVVRTLANLLAFFETIFAIYGLSDCVADPILQRLVENQNTDIELVCLEKEDWPNCYPKYWYVSTSMVILRLSGLACCCLCCICCTYGLSIFICCAVGKKEEEAETPDGPNKFDRNVPFYFQKNEMVPGVFARLQKTMGKKDLSTTCMICYNDFMDGARLH